MKRFFIWSLITCMVLSAFALSASALDMEGPVGDVNTPYRTSTVTYDGILSPGEWDAAGKFSCNWRNMKAVVPAGFTDVPEAWNVDVYTMWDETNFYIAFDVTDPTPTAYLYSHIDEGSGSPVFTAPGDFIQFCVDLGPSVQTGPDNGLICAVIAAKDNNFTDLGLLTRYQSSKVPEMDFYYTENPTAGGTKNDTGWIVEIGCPWSKIIEDMVAKSGLTPTVEAGAKMTALLIAQDYIKDSDTTSHCTSWFGSSITGYEEDAYWAYEKYGITMNLLAAESGTTAADTTAAGTTAADTTTGSTPNTADFIIMPAIALIGLAGTAAGIVIKKRR